MDTSFYREYYEIEGRHWWFRGRRAILRRTLEHHLPPGPDRRVLDVGCGTGTMLEELSRFGAAEGVDASEAAVSFCHERGMNSVQQVGSGPLPFANGSFDLVTALDVIEHVGDDVGLLNDLRRVLRPGGLLVLMVPAFWFLWGRQDEISHHHRRYVKRELRMRLDDAGMYPQRLTYFNSLLFPPIAAIRLMRPERDEGDLKSDFTMTRPGRLNSLLASLFSFEARLLDRLDLPAGVSILAVATAPSDAG